MKKFLPFLLLAMAELASAAVVYEPVPTTGRCSVASATNATPIRVTVSNISHCAVVEDSVINVDLLGGITNAWSNPQSADQLARIAKNVSGNSFDLYDLASNPVAGNAAYTTGGWIRRVQAKTIRASGPILLLDGTGGTKTTAMLDTSATGRKNVANAAYNQLISSCDSYKAYGGAWGQGYANNPATQTANCALAYFLTGDTAALAAAAFDIANPDQFSNGVAAQNNVSGGGNPGSGITHYLWAISLWKLAFAYNYAEAGLTSPQKAAFWGYVFDNNVTWRRGGTALDGATAAVQRFKVGWNTDGTPDLAKGTAALSGTTVTGSGTTFTSTVAVGDVITIPHSTESESARGFKVTAVNSNTSLTVANPLGLSPSGHYLVSPPWTSGVAGGAWIRCHYTNAWGCGINSADPSSVDYASSGNPGNFGIYGNDDGSNLNISTLESQYPLGILACRAGYLQGCWMAGRASIHMWDAHAKYFMPRVAGADTKATRGYNVAWMRGAIDNWQAIHAGSFESPNDYLPNGWKDDSATYGNRTWVPGVGFAAWGDYGDYPDTPVQIPGQSLTMQFLYPGRTASQYGKFWLTQRGESWSFNGGDGADMIYVTKDPAMTSATSPTTWVAKTTYATECAAIWTTCDTEAGAYSAQSRTGWTQSDTFLQFEASSPECYDHCGQGPSSVAIFRNARRVFGNWNGAGSGNSERSYVIVDSPTNTLDLPGNSFIITGTTKPVGGGAESYLAVKTPLMPWYRTAANVSHAYRSVFHFKAGGRNLVMMRDEVGLSTPRSIVGKYMVPQMCGTSTSSSCANVTRAALTFRNEESGVSGVLGKVASLSTSAVIMTTDNNSDTNISTAGISGGQFKICNSANGTSCDATSSSYDVGLVVLPTNGGTPTFSAVVPTRASTFAVLEYRDATLPAALAQAHLGTSISSAAFTLGHSGNAQLIGAGFEPATYSISVDSTPVSGCTALNVVAGDGTLSCSSVPSGSVVISQVGAALDITTTDPMPGATRDSSYSQALTIVGGTSPYTCTVLSGSLPTGLSLTGAGGCTISGTPTVAASFSFTMRVADNASATNDQALSILVSAPPVTSWYVSTTGSSGNSGSIGSPWDLATAITSASVLAGDTVYLRAGTYTGHNVITRSGTAGNFITYRPYPGERVIFDRQVLVSGDNASIRINGSYVTIRDFEFTNSNTDRRSAEDGSNPTDARPTGIDDYGFGNRIINNVIHNVGGGLGIWTDTASNPRLVSGNIIFDGGWQGLTDRGHGHGMYIQGRGGTFQRNIVFGGFNQGLQIYGSGDTGLNLSDMTFDRNVIFNSGALQLEGFERNMLLGGGQFCTNNSITNNEMFYPIGSSAQTLNAGYATNLFCVAYNISNNYLVGGPLRIVGQRAAGAGTTVANNTVYSSVGFEDTAPNGGFSSGFVAPYDASGNTIISSTPGTNRVVIHANAHESNRAAVVAYDWTGAGSVAVDFSSFMTPGTSYEVIDVQNYFGTPVATGTYSSGTVSIPTNLTTRASVIGANPGTDFAVPTHTPQAFNVYIVREAAAAPGAAARRGIWRGKF